MLDDLERHIIAINDRLKQLANRREVMAAVQSAADLAKAHGFFAEVSVLDLQMNHAGRARVTLNIVLPEVTFDAPYTRATGTADCNTHSADDPQGDARAAYQQAGRGGVAGPVGTGAARLGECVGPVVSSRADLAADDAPGGEPAAGLAKFWNDARDASLVACYHGGLEIEDMAEWLGCDPKDVQARLVYLHCEGVLFNAAAQS